jgi:hypothetical protein
VLDAQVFETCFRDWISGWIGLVEGVVAFDGKTVRGSKDGPNTAAPMPRLVDYVLLRNPRQHESGSSAHSKPRLSKVGHASLRQALHMPARAPLCCTDWGKCFRLRLSAAGKAPKLIIGSMMHQLFHVAFGVLKSGLPFNPALQDA